MRGIISTLLIWLVFGVNIVTPSKKCKMLTYTAPSPFQFAQQIFWDDRINSIFVADASAPDGAPSLFRFDWESATFYSASISNSETGEAISFVVPASSSSSTLLVGQTPCISRLHWDGVSLKADRIDDIACRNAADLNGIDRGAISPNGTLYMSIIPSTYCTKKCSPSYPDASVVYLDLESEPASIKNALIPGTYSNGIVFDSTKDKAYIADDCSASIFAAHWNPTDKSLRRLNTVFKFPRNKATTNYPSGMVIDQCSNVYIGDRNSGLVYYFNPQTGEKLKTYKVPGSHVTAVGIVGTDLDYLCVLTGVPYHDIYGNLKSNSTNPGDGKMYLIPISSECSGYECNGKPGRTVDGF